MPALEFPGTPHMIRVRTLAGSDVSATVEDWVRALVLALEPADLERLLAIVETVRHPVIVAARPEPADPAEFLPKESS